MIQHIKIENYKSIPSLELDLGRVNVFIGENGCGKTNILEAVAVASAAAGDKLGDEFLATRGVRNVEVNKMKSGFKDEFLNKQIILKMSSKEGVNFGYSLDGDIQTNSLKVIEDLFLSESLKSVGNAFKGIFDKDSQKMLEKVIPEFKKLLDEEFVKKIDKALDKKLKPLKIEKLNDLSIANFLLYAPENTYLRRFEEEGQIRPLGIRGEGLFSHLADLARNKSAIFQKINENLQLIDWVEGFEIPKDLIFNERRIQIRDRYLDEGIQYIDQRSSNEGFLYLLFYVTLFVSPYTPKFFAIDNIDNALNPRLCAKLIGELVRLAKEHDKQVIVTAHNPGLLDGLNLNDEEQRLFVISRNKLGHTKALRIEQKPSANGHEPVKLSEQFLRGYIGGIPNI